MARELSAAQKRELAEFVTTLYRWGGYTSHVEWARDSGVHHVSIGRVMGAKAGMDGLNLIRLYKAAELKASTERPVTAGEDDEFRQFAIRLLALAREAGRRLGLEEADG